MARPTPHYSESCGKNSAGRRILLTIFEICTLFIRLMGSCVAHDRGCVSNPPDARAGKPSAIGWAAEKNAGRGANVKVKNQ